MRLPGQKQDVKTFKVDVAERHIVAAFQMMSIGCNPFSTHLVVKAAHEIIEVLASKRGVPLDWDPRVHIKGEHLTDYRKLANKAYNYFKHADRDAEAPYDGPSYADLQKLNEVLTIFNIHGLLALTGKLPKALIHMSTLIAMKHPDYFKEEFLAAQPAIAEKLRDLPKDPEVIRMAWRACLKDVKLLPAD